MSVLSTRVPFSKITLLVQSAQMRLQLQIVAILGVHESLSVIEIAQYLFADRPDDELPLATVELAVRDLCKDSFVRRAWGFGKRQYCLAWRGKQLHDELCESIATSSAHA